ncbi:rhodanese-like domain-containing protein [Imbroritus primus]|uniref:rhodanese-like domain-containing protein n=1 Tax=Imbroritus primus TaxID=3058603 RepID=UPI003D16165F
MQNLTAPELAAWLAEPAPARGRPVLLDVREDWEFQTCALPGSVHMPMGSVPQRAAEVHEDAPVICICHHGMRSLHVASFLERQGFTDVYNLTGGVDAWARQVDPQMPVY